MDNQPIAYADAAAVPVNFGLIEAIQQSAELQRQVAEAQHAQREAQEQMRLQALPKCLSLMCGQVATLFCPECGNDLCAAHSAGYYSFQENKEHIPFIVPLAEKAAAITAKAQRGH